MPGSEHKHTQHDTHMAGENSRSDTMNHAMHNEHAGHEMAEKPMHDTHMDHTSHTTDNTQAKHPKHANHADHSGHEEMFRRRFWGSLLLSIPVLIFSPMIQELLGYSIPSFSGSYWIPFIFSLIIFAYGGIPFIQMAIPEIRNREPGMMTLISLAISVALVYSVAAQLFGLGEDSSGSLSP